MIANQTVDVVRLAEFLSRGAASVSAGRHATDPGSPVGPYMHGPNGLFHVYDAEQPLISLQRYGTSLATRLPAKGTNFLYPLFGYIMGWGPGGGEDEPATSCDLGPTQGSLYTCWQSAQFGRYKRTTTTIDVANIGNFTGRSEFSDFLLLNPPGVDQTGGILNLSPTVPGGSPLTDLNREFLLRMLGLGIEFERLLGPQVYYGDPSNSIGDAGGYAEYPGLDLLISHGHVDARRAGVTCEGLDSLLYDFNFADVSSGNGQTLVALMTAVMRYLRTLARITNLDPVEWILAMRDDLFNAIVDMWPCAYLSNRCNMGIQGTDNNTTGILDLTAIQGMRDAMRNGSYIEIDGMKVEVVRDSWIKELTSVTDQSRTLTPGQYSSDIYVLATVIRGNVASAYFEYLNWDSPNGAMDAVREAGRGQYFTTSDGGTYLWTLPPPTETCLNSSATVQPRLIIKAPHLCAHLSNLMYSPLIHQPDANPSDSFYTLSGSPDAMSFAIPTFPWS